MAEAVRYSGTITTRCQPEITALIDEAARRRCSKASEYIRQAVVAAYKRTASTRCGNG
jgi:hypothetical protein